MTRTHLDQLESQSILHFSRGVSFLQEHRDAVVDGEGLECPHLAGAEIFFGKVPFPVLHIDTTYEFPEMLEFREWATKHYKLNLDREDQRRGARARQSATKRTIR